MATFAELFAGRNLTGLIQGVKPGLPLVIPESFLTPTDPEVPGHTFEWLEFDGNRQMATIVSQDSPARRVGHQGARRKSATMFRSFESQVFTANDLRNIMLPDGTARDALGRAYVTRQTEEFRRRLTNLLQTCVQRMLLQWELHFNEKGEMLTSSSGATTSVVVNVPAGQKGQLNILGGGAIIGASWATSSTNIPGHIQQIKQQMRKLGGWQITEAFYGANIAGYILQNDYVKNLIQNTPALATQVFQDPNRVPQGFMGLNWHPADEAFYIDASGNVVDILGADEIVFTPSPQDRTWWKLAFGSEMVPRELGRVGQDATAMLSDLQEVFGFFSYATMSTNPVSIEQFYGLNFLPLVTATKAVCRADVTP